MTAVPGQPPPVLSPAVLAPPSGLDVARRLAILLAVGVVVVNCLLAFLSPEKYRETSLDQTAEMLRGRGGDDSWGAMHVALEQFQATPTTPLYTELFFKRLYRFQYPPSSLFALMALRLAGPDRVRIADGMVFEPWPPINDIVGWIFMVMTAAASAGVLELSLRRQPGFVDRPGLPVVRAVLVVALTATFYPVIKAFTLGQIQVWINALFALALFCWVYGRPAIAGVLIGLFCLIKPHYGVLLLWALLRREWRFLIAGGIAAGIGGVASIAVFGWANHVDYLQVLQFLSRHGESYFPNHSVNGLLNRWMSLSDPASYVILDLPAGRFPPFSPFVYGATLATSVAFMLYGLARSSPPGDRSRDFARMALCCTIASPIAWEHHYGILLPIFMMLLAERMEGRWRLIALMVSYVLVTNFFPALNLLAATPWNPLQSYVLAAALVVLVLLHANATRGQPASGAPVTGT
ncbi:MAG: glycosyltransferase family 87 protein [Alphaproteobacteria bacterium]|nr:glycosyltransferase family 87 protein [Alphaproteobacteria bacterium]